MSTVLLIGEDDLLQQTRAAVLRTTGATTVCCNAVSAMAVQADRQCDLVVLCHSLSETLSAALTETIHSRWPSTPILRVAAVCAWGAVDTDTTFNAIASADPEHLVGRTVELLHLCFPHVGGGGSLHN
jgi:DNA-binding NarL/FixJ family response regulator